MEALKTSNLIEQIYNNAYTKKVNIKTGLREGDNVSQFEEEGEKHIEKIHH